MEADDCGGDDEEDTIDVGVSFVADGETPELINPVEGALDYPAIFAEVLAAFDAASGDAGCDVTSAEIMAAAVEVISVTHWEGDRLFGQRISDREFALAA